ncbi:MAG: hypothetical protein JRI23_21805 [Deltaproteobacteria bacterium]|nr:hypothetical protein [Deltaproteobacteria bacterium]MBW2534585.1 hypothetical protein [Deltaproteobacteria bacterium]
MRPVHKLRVALLLSTLLLVLLGPWGGTAAARPGGDEDRAVEIFRQAQEQYEAGRYQAALEKFREVTTLIDSPNAWLYIARCLKKVNDKPRAFEAMSEAVALANKLAEKDQSYLRTRDAAAAEREAIVTEIARVIVAAADPPEGLKVDVDGRTLEPSDFGRQLGVFPREITITAEAPGHQPFLLVKDMSPGSVETIAINMRPIDGGGDGGPIVVDGSSEALWISGFVVAGVGVVGMTLFAVFGSMSNARFAEIEEECGSPPCTDAKYTDLIDEGETWDLVANIGLGVGAAGLVAGTVMIILGWPDGEGGDEPGDEPDDDVDQEIAPLHVPAGFGLQYRLTF